MGQYRFYITWDYRLVVGAKFKKGFCLEAYIGPLMFGIGLTETASGFGFWQV